MAGFDQQAFANNWIKNTQANVGKSDIQLQQEAQARAAAAKKRPALTPEQIKAQSDADVAKMQQQMLMDQQAQTTAAQNGYDKDGKPIERQWQSLLGENGLLQDKYKLNPWQNVNPNTDALNAFSATAMRTAGSASPAAQAALEKQQLEQGTLMDQAAKMGQNSLRGTMSTMAQSGGLSSGARERAIRQSGLMQMLGQQNTLRQGMTDRAGIMANDESQRMSQLQQLQGMNNTQADAQLNNQKMAMGIDQTNLTNSLAETDKKRYADLEAYKQKMAAWGADKTATAQANASGGGKK